MFTNEPGCCLLAAPPSSHLAGLGSMRVVLALSLLVQSCGAWILPAPPLRPHSWPRKISEPWKIRKMDLHYGGVAAGTGRWLTAAVDSSDLPAEGSAADGEESGVDIVKARLSKPVGLMLAEREIGLPGLVVDDLAEGGSAKECGLVRVGMALLSAGGVDCGELVFDQVLELLQNTPAEEPIDFVFSETEGPP